MKLDLPVGCSIFPGDIFRPPKIWTERAFSRLIYWNEVTRRPLRWPRTAGDFCSRSAGPFPERARNLTCANLSARTTLSSSARRPSSATDPRQLLRFSRSHRSFFSGLFRTSPSAETSSAAASAPRTSIESTSKKRLLRTSQRQRATDRNRPKKSAQAGGSCFEGTDTKGNSVGAERRTAIPNVSGCYRCKPMWDWLPDQGSNLGPTG